MGLAGEDDHGAVARQHYLTGAQVSRLVFPASHDEFRYARRRLGRLVQAGLLLRLKPLPVPPAARLARVHPGASRAGAAGG